MGHEIRIPDKISFTRAQAVAGLLLFVVCAFYEIAGSETLTMTTYYPAPYGGYASLLTTGQTLLARDGGSVGIGTPTPGAKLDIKGLGNTAATLGLGIRNSNNTAAMVVRDDGNVGIGTSNPQAKLDVNGLVKIGNFASDSTATNSLLGSLPADGSIYYNTTSNNFRGMKNGSWANLMPTIHDCVGTDIYPWWPSLTGGVWVTHPWKKNECTNGLPGPGCVGTLSMTMGQSSSYASTLVVNPGEMGFWGTATMWTDSSGIEHWVGGTSSALLNGGVSAYISKAPWTNMAVHAVYICP